MGHNDISGHEPKWEAVFDARNYAVAGMVKGLLEAEGLTVTLRSVLGVPHLGYSGQMSVLVPEDEAARGRDIVSAYLRHPAVDAGTGARGPGQGSRPEEDPE